MRKSLLSGLPFVLLPFIAAAQRTGDSTRIHYLKDVRVRGIRSVRGTGHLPEEHDGIIYAGKKNEVIIVDSLDANKAINNTRQILGRIPGLNITETETGGFTANGIATRGLNPTQSIEMNTRQNGYNISADIYGYNEAYYLPPMEAVSRIEMVRGAASLQFGSQFGGLVNYVLNTAPKDKPFEFYTSQTGGSFGLFNSFNSFAGTLKKWSYYSFIQYRTLQGYRPNSQQQQATAFARVQYNASDKLSVGLEYSLLRNRIKMPGGLNDSMFQADPKSSFRARNWLKSPWNVVTADLNYTISPATTLNVKSTYLFSSRALVWRNEEGGPGELDTIDPATGQYVPREVQDEVMHNTTTEVRLMHQYKLGKTSNTLAGGLRYSYAWFKRQGGGPGTTGSDFDLSISGPYEYALDFTTTNIAPFVENIFRLGKRFSITPGIRLEYLYNTAKGYITDSVKVFTDDNKSRVFPLLGIGAEYKTGQYTNVYANFSQAYRPVDYAQLTPIGITSKIDPHMKDASGFNADLGYRGTVKNFLNFDLGVFYLAYNNRIGTILQTNAQGEPYTLRTNVANSVHKGVESYVELNILKWLYPLSKRGISIFDAFGYTDARYTSGEFKNNRVEAAVKYINRVGLSYMDPHFSVTFQLNHVGDAYGDATNAKFSEDPVAGYIPAYTVMDVSATYRWNRFVLKGGINNLGNKAYFTRRTDEYPGPGIIPSDGRSFYAGIAAKF
ncbi:TonB-dependent receptor domain-containing protein [Chitinophaga sp. HK235]|uniref:TonB-dependent receptor family protein n=1 Tax=Chitinophaga sp. HK235 TaxID=2952571 RepID=UPI001BABD857|nr:TonB-dependent receptor [Chitinophaga sp. HK235]